ncbi:unnamed protein product, partial [Mesorhabditis spiculigera]
MSRRTRADVWEFFSKVDQLATCQLCGAQFRYVNGTTSSIRRHLFKKHADIADKIGISGRKDVRDHNRENIPLTCQLPSTSTSMLNISVNPGLAYPDVGKDIKDEIGFEEDVHDYFLDDGNTNTEALLYATGTSVNSPTEPSPSQEDREPEQKLDEPSPLQGQLDQATWELKMSRLELKNANVELEKMQRLYMNKSIELDLMREEYEKMKGKLAILEKHSGIP